MVAALAILLASQPPRTHGLDQGVKQPRLRLLPQDQGTRLHDLLATALAAEHRGRDRASVPGLEWQMRSAGKVCP